MPAGKKRHPRYYYDYTDEDCIKIADAVLEHYRGLSTKEILAHWSSNLSAGCMIAGLILKLRQQEK